LNIISCQRPCRAGPPISDLIQVSSFVADALTCSNYLLLNMKGPSIRQGERTEHGSFSEHTSDAQPSDDDVSDSSEHQTKRQVRVTDRARYICSIY
jgi:hypothetical protein